jgi:hypothetical protein
VENRSDKLPNEQFEAKQNLTGFFGLLLEVAIRNNIDIGLYENNGNTNNTDKSE